MGCNCKHVEIILGLIIVIFSFVNFYSQWVIVIAAAALILHALKCGNCGSCDMPEGKKNKKK